MFFFSGVPRALPDGRYTLLCFALPASQLLQPISCLISILVAQKGHAFLYTLTIAESKDLLLIYPELSGKISQTEPFSAAKDVVWKMIAGHFYFFILYVMKRNNFLNDPTSYFEGLQSYLGLT